MNQDIRIPYTDLSVQVYERLKEMVLTGQLAPGDKIKQEHIAKVLGISRMPLHKAFQMLENEFLVESIPRKGIFVKKHSIREIMDAFECREGLEGIAARRAAKNVTDEEITSLKALFEPYLQADNIDMVSYRKADQILHDTIIRLSGNIILQKMNTIGNVLIMTYPRGIVLPIKESLSDHIEILDALEKRDGTKAEQLVRNHSRRARNILEQELMNIQNHRKNEL